MGRVFEASDSLVRVIRGAHQIPESPSELHFWMTQFSSHVRLIKRASATVALLAVSACATLALGDGAHDQQLTAAITEFREETVGQVALSELELRPLTILDGSEEPRVEEGGPHAGAWLTQVMNSGLADRLCAQRDPCEASPDVTIFTLSGPYRANDGVFVDARAQSVTDTGYGIVRTTRLIRLRIAQGESGWRVIAKTPLWETSGS